MQKLIITFLILVVIAVGTYYLVFKNSAINTPASTALATASPSSDISSPTLKPAMPVSNTPKTSPAGNSAVDIKDFSFNPSALTIKVGTKVTWTNNDSVPHRILSDSGNLLDSPVLEPGQSFHFTFTTVGTFSYHCSIHPMMKGQIIVAQ